MRLTLTALLLVVPLAFASADVAKVLTDAELMHDQGAFADAVKLLLGSVDAAAAKEKAELYWRAARETLELGDVAEKAGKAQADILSVFAEGEGYADKAIASDPQNDLGYYWKSANIGRWGQVKGIVNALFKASPMRDLLVKELSLNSERSEPYYVLGQLYRELPSWPVSFGNIDAAVSLGRKAVDLRQSLVEKGIEQKLDYNFPTELAKSLYKRNWSASGRAAEEKNKASRLSSAATPLDKASLYEATVTLKNESDRDEAQALVHWVVSELERTPSLTSIQKKDLDAAKDVLKGW